MTTSLGREMARRLLAREIAGVEEPAAIGAAMQGLCTRVSANLRRSVGDDGYNAVPSRVLARTEPEHSALLDIRRLEDDGIHLDGVVASVATDCWRSHYTARRRLLGHAPSRS